MGASGRQFADRYEVLRLLGRGGMGDVYLAQDSKFGRLVAIKFFRENPDTSGARSRFLREAATAGRLVHPNIVTVYDYGEHGGELYIAMEYIAGETLARLIDLRLPDSLHEKIVHMLGLCAGLSFAHDAGVLHRDVKPANLMVAPSGILKVLDFGIARALDAPGTRTHVAGSLQYMSPEQISGAPLDARSDIFAVGAVSYELLTFEQAFAADTLEATLERIRFGSPRPIADIVPGVDPALVSIVNRALQKDPDARFPDLRSMERELQAVLRRLPAEQTPHSVRMVLASISTPMPPRADPDDCAESDPQLSLSDMGADSIFGHIQARLLDVRAASDYLWVAVLGAIPLGFAWAIGADRDALLDPASSVYADCLDSMGPRPVVQGYGSRWNWWPLFGVLPFILFALRYTAMRLFPLPYGTRSEDCGILRKIPQEGRRAVAGRLASAALDSRNLQVAVVLAIIIMAVDLGETIGYYAAAVRGASPTCPREFDWTVRFLAGPPVSLTENLLLVALAYPLQFFQAVLGLMLFGLIFRHNLFYLTHIYLRHRKHRPVSEQIVLLFDDVERCFGLRVLHSTFNYQVAVLIVGGFVILLSRFMNVDATGLGVQYGAVLTAILTGKPDGQWVPPAPAITARELFPDAGQVMLALAWITCFLIVAMPSAVKFLPLIHRHVRLVGRREYLLEFVPVATNLRLNTQEEVDVLALKFSRSSFWPAGDERARTMYTVAYFVFFMVLVPAPSTSTTAFMAHASAVFVLSYGCMKLTFWLFRKVLVNVDATLGS